jgi:hypothetical protein
VSYCILCVIKCYGVVCKCTSYKYVSLCLSAKAETCRTVCNKTLQVCSCDWLPSSSLFNMYVTTVRHTSPCYTQIKRQEGEQLCARLYFYFCSIQALLIHVTTHNIITTAVRPYDDNGYVRNMLRMCWESFYSHIYNTSCFESIEISTPLRLGNTFFWDMTLRHWSSSSRRFERKYCFHLQRLIRSKKKNLLQSLNVWIWSQCFLSKYQEPLISDTASYTRRTVSTLCFDGYFILRE